MKRMKSLATIVIFIIIGFVFVINSGLFSGSKLKNYTNSVVMPQGLVFVGETNGIKTSSGAEVSGKIKNTFSIPVTVTVTAAFYDKNSSVICYASDTVAWIASEATESFTITAETEDANGFMIISAKIS